jgi:hypothetical protein
MNMTRGDLEKILERVKADNLDSEGPLRHILQFDEAVRTLYRAEIPAYVALENASAQLAAQNVTPELKASLPNDQKKFAREISTAWKQFDAKIGGMNEQGGFLTAFRVNDTILQRADPFTAGDKDRYSSDLHIGFMTSLLEARFPSTLSGTENKVRKMLDSDIQRRRTADDTLVVGYATLFAILTIASVSPFANSTD